MLKNGYYAKLIKSDYKEKINDLKNKEEMKKKEKIKFMRHITKKHKFLNCKTLRYQLGQKGEQYIKFKPSELFYMVKDNKFELFLGTICGLLFGVGLAYLDFLIGKLETEFALKDNEMMKKNVLKWSLFILVLVFFWVICDYINNFISFLSSSFAFTLFDVMIVGIRDWSVFL